MAAYSDDAIIRVRDLTVRLNGNLILNHLDLDVRRGEIDADVKLGVGQRPPVHLDERTAHDLSGDEPEHTAPFRDRDEHIGGNRRA